MKLVRFVAFAFGAAIKWVIKKALEPIIRLVVSMYFPKHSHKKNTYTRKTSNSGVGR